MAGLVRTCSGHPRLVFCVGLRRGCPRHRRTEATPFFERLWAGMTVPELRAGRRYVGQGTIPLRLIESLEQTLRSGAQRQSEYHYFSQVLDTWSREHHFSAPEIECAHRAQVPLFGE